MTCLLLLQACFFLQNAGAPCAVQRGELALAGISKGPYGSPLGLAGTFAAIGSEFAGTAGAVHLFAQREGRWEPAVVLEPPLGRADERFGTALVLADERLVVGAFGTRREDGVASGSLYVYELTDGWRLQARLFPEGLSQPEYFGVALAADGERILAGAPEAADHGSRSGAVYIFRRDAAGSDGWVQEARLLPDPTGAALGEFGGAVALRGDTALIGVPGHARVDVFRREGDAWRLAERLSGERTSRFGSALAIAGDSVLVGAPYWPGATIPRGAVHVFERGEGHWKETATITQSTSSTLGFGSSVDVDDELAAIGSLGYLGVYPSHGTWFVQRSGDGWGLPQPVVPLASPASFSLGNVVALADRRLLVGDASLTAANGNAFFFDVGHEAGGNVVTRQGPGNVQALAAAPAAPGALLVLEIGPFPAGYDAGRVFAFEAPGSLPVGSGTLLCQDAGSGPLLVQFFSGTPGSVRESRASVPPAPELAGFSFCVQALFESPARPLLLTNALDIRLGACSCSER